MQYLKSIIFIMLLGGIAGCTKTPSANSGTVSTTNLVASGTLQKQGITTYQYGTHILVVNATTQYVLESTYINLDPYVGKQVKIAAVDMHYHVENGPELYNVTFIALQ